MNSLTILFGLIVIGIATAQNDPDIWRNVTELITSRGYPCEDHYATTPDGFILSLQRIPHGKGKQSNSSAPVVFLMHGFTDASHTWVINGEVESLGFILADAGFDVWMGNSRGNCYSQRNIYYTPDQDEFWAWSWDEMAKYDLPTMIGYVTEQSNAKTISYIGHSQGTLQAFIAFSYNQQLAANINLFIALAPVVFMEYQTNLVLSLASDLPDSWIYDFFGVGGFPMDNAIAHFVESILPDFCEVNELACENGIFGIAGCNKYGQCDPGDMNISRVPVYSSHIGGASVQDLVHFIQLTRGNNVPMYNYGPAGNMAHYNQSEPPAYDIKNVKVPTYLFTGGNDNWSDPVDVERLQGILTNLVGSNYQPNYEHMDFVWGMNAHTLIYPDVVQLLRKFNN